MSNSDDIENGPSVPTCLTREGVPFEVWISVDKQAVPHYAREYNESKNEVTCWIESEAGKPFAINYKSTTDEYATGMQVLLDGCHSADFFVHPNRKDHESAMTYVRTSESEGRPLAFGILELTDDDAYLMQSSNAEAFGEIKLIVYKITSFEECHCDNHSGNYSWTEAQKVHERSKKGLTHQIKAGQTQQISPPRVFKTTGTRELLVNFVIRYRTGAMLQANGIIPPARDPSTSQVEREVSEELPDDDEDDTDEREKALLAELAQIQEKKRAKSSGGRPTKKIKVEPVAPKSFFKRGELIDLTDDVPKATVKPKRKDREMKKEIVDLTL